MTNEFNYTVKWEDCVVTWQGLWNIPKGISSRSAERQALVHVFPKDVWRYHVTTRHQATKNPAKFDQ